MDKYQEAAKIMHNLGNEIGKLRQIERKETNLQIKKEIHCRKIELLYQNLWYQDKYDRMWEEEYGSNEIVDSKYKEQKKETDKDKDKDPDDDY